jgi:signal transduction histidine kinase
LGHELVERRGKRFSYADVHRRVLERYAPPSVIITHESEIVHISDHASRFLRYADGEPAHSLLSLIHPELRLELRTALVQTIHSGRSVEARRVHLTRYGRTYYVNMVVRPFLDEEVAGSFILVLFNEVETSMSPELKEPGKEIRDTVLTQLEKELQALQTRLQNAIEQSETSTEALQSINDDLATANFELKSKVAETAKIIEDLLDLSRVQTGKLKLTKTAVDLVELTRGIVDAASPQAHAAEVEISISAPGNVSILLDADPERVEQIVSSLLINAIKFTPPHCCVCITLSIRDGMGCIEARDDGIDMTRESVSGIFEMSGQFEGRHLPQTRHGLEIGLALAKQLVDAHGGRMNADSPGEGLGTTFSVHLPLWSLVD